MIRAALICALAAGPLAAEPLRIGTESDYRPYIFLDQSGERTGFDPELMDLICARGEFDCTWIEMPFSELFTGVAADRYDIAIGGIGISPGRDAFVDWSAPYRDQNGSAVRFAGLNSNIDVTTARIGVVGSTKHELVLKNSGYDPIPYPNNTAIYDALLAGEIEVFAATSSYLAGLTDTEGNPLHDLGRLDYEDSGIRIAVSKNQSELRARLNTLIENLRDEGELQILERRWFPTTPARDL